MNTINGNRRSAKAIGRQLGLTAAAVPAAMLLAGLPADPAAADEKMQIRVGGYMEQWLGFQNNSQSFLDANGRAISHVDVQDDTEIHFDGKKVLDNGVEFVVHVELEGNTEPGAQIDGSYLEVTLPTLGLIQIGGAEHAAWQVHNASPDVGIGNHDGDYMNWILTPDGFTDSAITGFNPDIGVANKVVYFSPTFAGFAISGSFAPDTMDIGNAPNPAFHSSWTAALTYGAEFNGIGISADIGYGRLNKSVAINSQTVVSGGLNVTFGGFTLGGSLARYDENLEGNQAGTFMTGLAYDAGVSYSTGPYAVSLTWLRSEMEGDNTVDGTDVKNSVMLSGAYSLGEGVTAIASAFYVDYDDETSLAINNNHGPGFVAGISIEF